MKSVIGSFKQASQERMLGPLMLISAADVRPGLAMLHNDFCFHKFSLLSEFLLMSAFDRALGSVTDFRPSLSGDELMRLPSGFSGM
jgi:hypothetical protein